MYKHIFNQHNFVGHKLVNSADTMYPEILAVFKFGGLVPKRVQEILNLMVWHQIERKKYWQNLNLAVVPCSVLHHHEHCACVYQGVLPSSHLKYLKKALSLQIYKKIIGSVLVPS